MTSSMRSFLSTIEDCGLIYISFVGPPLTWNNGQDPPNNIQERLDHVLVNPDFKNLFERVRVAHEDFFCSNHKILNVILDFHEYLEKQGENA